MTAMPYDKKLTIGTFNKHKSAGEKFAMLTCYDATMAALQQMAGIEMILVGDSLAGPVLGLRDTLGVSLDLSVALTAAVRRGAPLSYLVADMPFLTYATPEQAVKNGGRYMVEAQADCVKVECDRRLLETIRAMATAGIPVMPHLGFTPQRVAQIGLKIAGKTAASAIDIIETADMMVEAGASAFLLEAVPPEVAAIIARKVPVPVVGCGAGGACDGYVMVTPDMLNMSIDWSSPTFAPRKAPKFVKKYADIRAPLEGVFRAYLADVQSGAYPAPEHNYPMTDEAKAALLEWDGKN
jgi:3-methyl-2-oxobutanoate hydroxymethyltransferase